MICTYPTVQFNRFNSLYRHVKLNSGAIISFWFSCTLRARIRCSCESNQISSMKVRISIILKKLRNISGLWRFVILAHVNRTARANGKRVAKLSPSRVYPGIIDFLLWTRLRRKGWKKREETSRVRSSLHPLSLSAQKHLPSTIFDVIEMSDQSIVISTHDHVLTAIDTVRGSRLTKL